MGRTLFWYIFKDLVKVFLMASGALAGILSFGGLLRPLTQQGLDAGQVSKILTYFTPAMTTYSFPVAALFAATVVYGRLSADNELTGCRAGGISLGPFLGMAFPALTFGLLVAIVQLLFLCYVVPVYTLKVEKVIYSNLAKLVATRIERTHKIELGNSEIFAQRAILPPRDPHGGPHQKVILEGVSIVSYEHGDPRRDRNFKDPHFKKINQFYLASDATVDIEDRSGKGGPGGSAGGDDQVRVLIGLNGGCKFPREWSGGMQAGVGVAQFGPLEINSPIKEDPKFMTVDRLKWLYEHPEKSRHIGSVLSGFVRRDQQLRYLVELRDQLNRGDRQVVFTLEAPADAREEPERLVLSIADNVQAIIKPGVKVDVDSVLTVTGVKADAVRLDDYHPGSPAPAHQEAKDLIITAHPDVVGRVMNVSIELQGRTPVGATQPMSGKYSELVTVPMAPELAALNDRTVDAYTRSVDPATKRKSTATAQDLKVLSHELVSLGNGIVSESNSRASFAVSCLILVLVGCSLGMMFRSGNFLTAFAISFIPALICITLIVAGQQTCRAVPWNSPETHNPLRVGVSLIWSGNALNMLLAGYLLWRLQKQ